MKTIIIRTMLCAVITLLIGTFTVQAQDYFFDRKYEEGKLISKVKYEKSYTGLYEKTYFYKYSYTLLGELEMEDVYKWNKAKEIWVASHRVVRQEDMLRNKISLEYTTWNPKKETYNEPTASLIYQMDETGMNFMYLATKQNDKLNEIINQFIHNFQNISER